MPWFGQDRLFRSPLLRPAAAPGTALLAMFVALTGCANPGPPHSPSLHLPAPPHDLSAERNGDVVELRFTAPQLSTDKLHLPMKTVRGSFCRQVDRGPCVTPPGAGGSFALLDADGRSGTVVWKDALPAELAGGPRRLLGYRVELFNAEGRSAGPSEPTFAVSGLAPARVKGLAAQGSRRGVVLRWQAEPASAGDVLLRREDVAAETEARTAPRTSASTATRGTPPHGGRKPADPVLWMVADPHPAPGAAEARSLDAGAQFGVAYLYRAARQQTVQIGGRTLTLRSELSDPVSITLRPVYPPAAPTGVVAAGFSNGTSPEMHAPFGVDLVWQPVDDPGVAGYNVYRQRIDAQGNAQEERAKLTPAPVREPGFHDGSARPTERYRYSVTAVDTDGNESAAATTVLEPSEIE